MVRALARDYRQVAGQFPATETDDSESVRRSFRMKPTASLHASSSRGSAPYHASSLQGDQVIRFSPSLQLFKDTWLRDARAALRQDHPLVSSRSRLASMPEANPNMRRRTRGGDSRRPRRQTPTNDAMAASGSAIRIRPKPDEPPRWGRLGNRGSSVADVASGAGAHGKSKRLVRTAPTPMRHLVVLIEVVKVNAHVGDWCDRATDQDPVRSRSGTAPGCENLSITRPLAHGAVRTSDFRRRRPSGSQVASQRASGRAVARIALSHCHGNQPPANRG